VLAGNEFKIGLEQTHRSYDGNIVFSSDSNSLARTHTGEEISFASNGPLVLATGVEEFVQDRWMVNDMCDRCGRAAD